MVKAREPGPLSRPWTDLGGQLKGHLGFMCPDCKEHGHSQHPMPFLMAPCTYVVWVVFEGSGRLMFSDPSDFIWNRNSEVAWLWEVREPGQLLWAVKRPLPAPGTF